MSKDQSLEVTVRKGADGQWYYCSADPFTNGQHVGEIRPQWVDEVIAKAEAESNV